MTEDVEFTGEPIDANDVLPPPGAPVKVVRSVRLPFDVSERLDSVAADRGITASELIRDLVERGLAARLVRT